MALGNSFKISFFSSWSVLVQTFFEVDFPFVGLLWFPSLVSTLSLVSCWLSFSEIILDICDLILFLPGFRVVMQCNDAITWVLASPSLLPFRGNQVLGSSILEKKNCVREMTVEVRFFSGHPWCYLGNISDFPYNRNDAIYFHSTWVGC